MTALVDEYIAVYSAARVLQVSNPENTASVSDGTARIEKAASAAIFDFEQAVGIAFDGTIQDHLTVAVDGVDAHLTHRAAPNEATKRALGEWRATLDAYRMRQSAAAISPQTDSNYLPSQSPTERPPFDDSALDRLRVRPPRASRLTGDRGW